MQEWAEYLDGLKLGEGWDGRPGKPISYGAGRSHTFGAIAKEMLDNVMMKWYFIPI